MQRRGRVVGTFAEPREADGHPAADRIFRVEPALFAHEEDGLLAGRLIVRDMGAVNIDGRVGQRRLNEGAGEAARPQSETDGIGDGEAGLQRGETLDGGHR